MLKADFHIHTNNDPKDKFISYSNKEVIDKAFELGFEVIAITLHGKHTYDKKLADYAKKKDILLISGIEANINKKEVVILNAKKGVFKVKTFSQLRKYKKKNPNIFVLAPHPFYPKGDSLNKHFISNIDIFDGVEYSHYYCKTFNHFNEKAVKASKKYKKPLIGTSDMHFFFQFNSTYSLVNAEKNVKSVIDAMKKGKVKVKSEHLSVFDCTRIIVPMFINKIRNALS